MKIPQRHIPARFVTLIPPEFPAAKITKQRKRKDSAIKAQTSSSTAASQVPPLSQLNDQQNDAALFSVLENFSSGDIVDLGDFNGSFDWM